MKADKRRWLSRGAFVVIVAAAVAVAPQLRAAETICNGSEQLGTCPPFDDGSCHDACVLAGFPDGGNCVGPCCTCFLR